MAPEEAYEYAEYGESYDNGWVDEEEASMDAGSGGGALPANVKIIYTADISLESTEFEASAAGLEAMVAKAGGWFERSSLDNGGSYRTAYYTVRIPAERFQGFCDQVGSLCKVNSLQKDARDVSELYYDTESRLVTQQTKLERLRELLAKAEDMADIISLESAISETELAIEQLTGTLRHYDSLVGYSTIEISLREVYKLTETEEPAIGFGAKLAAAFRSGTSGFVDGLQNAVLGLARNWTGWLIFLVICAVIALVIVRLTKRAKKRRAAMPPYPPYPAAPPAPPTPKPEEKK